MALLKTTDYYIHDNEKTSHGSLTMYKMNIYTMYKNPARERERERGEKKVK